MLTYVFQKRVKMGLRKAIEDLREVTLAALPGRWLKLLYFARLRRDGDSRYSHWGFEQKYGRSAETALREGHDSVYREVLRAPIQELVQDLHENKADKALTVSEESMIPNDIEEPASHFKYVLSTVKALLKEKTRRS